MIIFCDTNIVMEFLQQRVFAPQVRKIITRAIEQGDDLFISVGSFYTITYLTERYLKSDSSLSKNERLDRLRYILNSVLDTFKLCGLFSDSIRDGVNDMLFDDLEDSYQAHVAKSIGCDILLTINEKHFERYSTCSPFRIMTPMMFADKG